MASQWQKHQIELQKKRKKQLRRKNRPLRFILVLAVAAAAFFGYRYYPAVMALISSDKTPAVQVSEPTVPVAHTQPVETKVHVEEPKEPEKPVETAEVNPPVEEKPAETEALPVEVPFEEKSDEKSEDGRTLPKIVVISSSRSPEEGGVPEELPKDRLAEMIGGRDFQPDEIRSFSITDENGHKLFVRTTMDQNLQDWAMNQLPKTKSRAAALVALDPVTGNVLSMASYRADGEPVNVALESSFPAASLFKIITAAAAVEEKQMDSETTLAYDGRKSTLYKKNLTEDIKKGSHQVTLQESFASSINTVFGKIGAFSLGPDELQSFARRFQFNTPIRFELPVQESCFTVPEEEDPYCLAELASGFNRTTKVSPLHGAMLASAIINNGTLMEPTIVREVFDQENRIYYTHQPISLGQVVSERTVEELRKLMQATVLEGTGRKRFRDANRHKILSRLEIGGKSGTINNDLGQRVDWFVCYAKDKSGDDAIALASVVVHYPQLGTRSQELAREAIIRYFSPRFR